MKNKETGKLKLKNYAAYAIIDGANNLAFSVIGSYLSRFYTNLLHIGKWSSIVLITARIWDGINDPIMGFLAQSGKPGKNGKYRPFILRGGIPLALFAFLCFCKIPGLSTSAYIVWAFVTYIGYGMLYTVLLVPYGSLASVMTQSEKERSFLSVCRSIGAGIGNVPGGIIFPAYVFTAVASGSNATEMDSDRLMLVMGVYAVVMISFYFIGYSGVKENVASPVNPPKVNIVKTLKALFKSRVFLTMSVIGCLLIASNMYAGTVTTYLFPDYFGKPGMMMVYYVCTYIPMIVLMPFVDKLTKRFGKKEIIVTGLIISSVASLAMWLSHTENIWIFIVFNLIINLGVGFLMLEIWALALDIVDHREYTSGVREEATTYASFTFMRKIGQAIAGIAPNLLLYIGYNADNRGSTIIEDAVLRYDMYTVSTLVQFILYTLMLIFAIMYPLNKKRMNEMHEGLRLIRSSTNKNNGENENEKA